MNLPFFPPLDGPMKRRLLGLTLLCVAAPVPADLIVMRNGREVSGVITEENDLYVQIEVRGVTTPIPRERIASIEKLTPEENARLLLEQAEAALTNSEVPMARSLVEKARMMNAEDEQTIEHLSSLDRRITDLEEMGGTPEERRRRATAMLRQAEQAFDRIRMREGNELLMQALRADPTYQPAHDMFDKRLREQREIDPMIVAQYVADILYPQEAPVSTAIAAMLPSVYQELAFRYETSSDVRVIENYVKWLIAIRELFDQHPEWLTQATADQRALAQEPIEDLLGRLSEYSLAQFDYEVAHRKVLAWAKPDASAQQAELLSRVHVASVIRRAGECSPPASSFPGDTEQRLQANALDRNVHCLESLQSGNRSQGMELLEQVLNTQADLPNEYEVVIGRRLSPLLTLQTEGAVESGESWQAAEDAAIVMRFGEDPARRVEAARVLSREIHRTPWAPHLDVTVNGEPVDVEADQLEAIAQALTEPLAISFNENSTFQFTFTMNLVTSAADRERLTAALTQGVPADPMVAIRSIDFKLTASQPALGQMLESEWTVSALPATVVQLRERRASEMQSLTEASEGTTGTLPVAAAQPAAAQPLEDLPPLDDLPPLEDLPALEDLPELADEPAPVAVAETPTTGSLPLFDALPVAQPVEGPDLLLVASRADLEQFVSEELMHFLDPSVTLMTSHLEIPLINELLTGETRQ